MAYTVYLPEDISHAGKEYLSERGYKLVIGVDPNNKDVLKDDLSACDADAMLVRTARITREIIDAAPHLRVIGRHGIGVDNIDVDYCTEKGIQVTNAPVSNAVSVAEQTVCMMLACARYVVPFDAGVRRGQWRSLHEQLGTDLSGATLGLLGMGRIGSLVAHICHDGFGMDVVGFDAFLPPEKIPEYVRSAASIEQVFSEADFVSLHIPATAENRGIVNAELLSKMKSSAFLINCARGELVCEADLYDALKQGVLAGAALDVLALEPPAPDNPLFTLEQVILSPHSAALTNKSMDRMGLHAAMGIHAVLSGRTPEWPVNRIKRSVKNG